MRAPRVALARPRGHRGPQVAQPLQVQPRELDGGVVCMPRTAEPVPRRSTEGRPPAPRRGPACPRDSAACAHEREHDPQVSPDRPADAAESRPDDLGAPDRLRRQGSGRRPGVEQPADDVRRAVRGTPGSRSRRLLSSRRSSRSNSVKAPPRAGRNSPSPRALSAGAPEQPPRRAVLPLRSRGARSSYLSGLPCSSASPTRIWSRAAIACSWLDRSPMGELSAALPGLARPGHGHRGTPRRRVAPGQAAGGTAVMPCLSPRGSPPRQGRPARVGRRRRDGCAARSRGSMRSRRRM